MGRTNRRKPLIKRATLVFDFLLFSGHDVAEEVTVTLVQVIEEEEIIEDDENEEADLNQALLRGRRWRDGDGHCRGPAVPGSGRELCVPLRVRLDLLPDQVPHQQRLQRPRARQPGAHQE